MKIKEVINEWVFITILTTWFITIFGTVIFLWWQVLVVFPAQHPRLQRLEDLAWENFRYQLQQEGAVLDWSNETFP